MIPFNMRREAQHFCQCVNTGNEIVGIVPGAQGKMIDETLNCACLGSYPSDWVGDFEKIVISHHGSHDNLGD